MSAITVNKKVCLLGDFAVGKTSLVRRFVYDRFEDKYLSTIGVKVSRKTVVAPAAGRVIDLAMILWDLAGSEEVDKYRESYMRGAAGAVLVCDLSRPETFDHLPVYVDEFLVVNPQSQIILAANKSDLTEALRLAPNQIESYAGSLSIPYFLTSAKTGDMVEQLFRQLGRLLLAGDLAT
ncbi:MAG: GTP-binding protein [Anaerolineales bacterium]|nr:GTP-binding protein [Anaerolineales bacterium]